MKEIIKEIEEIIKHIMKNIMPHKWYHLEFSTDGKYIDSLIVTKIIKK